MQQNYNRMRKLNKLKASLLLLMMVCFALPAVAQTNVYMHTGSSTVTGNDVINFYDAGGKSSGPDYYWERWFNRSEDYTYTFKPEGNNKIKVTFKQFTAYTDNNGHSPAHAFYDHPQWALRLNTAELYIYDGMTTDAENLITMYTGSVLNEFTVIANGPMTFRFKSYGYREEGWEAEVQQVADYSLQKPAISFQVCDDQVLINANNKGGTIYYLLNQEPDPDDPLQGATEYNGSFPVDLNTTVYAIVKVGNNYSTAASLKYQDVDVTPTPGKPTITRTGNTITMAPAPLIGDINETYEVWYTTEEGGTYEKYTGPIEWDTPNTTFYAITKPVSCSSKISEEETLLFDKVQVPDPTIVFSDYDENTGYGKVTISCADGYVISYTTNGSDPTTTGGVAGPITINNVAAGTTVKAIAYKITNNAVDPNFKPSNIIVNLCLPGGEGSQGVYGNVVLLDDREPHSLSYFSEDSPIHSLKPCDIKITYHGNSPDGRTTMTDGSESNAQNPSSADFNTAATGVKVNHDANANQFVYLKTLENANPEGSNGTSQNYPYTMIPNPFQVRPVYEGTRDYTNGISFSQSVNNEVRDRNGNVVAYTAGVNAIQNNLGVVTPIEPTRGVNTLLTEGFESSTINTSYSSNGWYAYNAGNGNNWTRERENAHGGSYAARYYYNRNYPANCYLVSAPFTVSANMTQLTVSLYERVRNSSYAETFEVFFVKASDVTTLAGVASVTHYNAIDPDSYTNTNYVQQTGSVTSSVLAGQSVRVVVHCTSAADMSRLYIDDITVTEATLNTVTAVAGTGISTAYVAAGQSFPSGTTTTTLNNVANNSYVTFQATLSSGFAFDGWYNQNNTRVSTDLTYTCAITSNLTLTARGIPTYTVTAAKETGISTAYVAAGTSFSGTATSVTVAEGGSATFQATVASGYGFTGWYDEQDALVSTNLTYTVNNITGNFTLTAKASVTHTVTIAQMSHGTVTANPSSGITGTTVTLTINPESNYSLRTLTVTGNTSGETISLSGTGNTRTFVMPNENVTVNATFYNPMAIYRGFYAWRVKSMSEGLSIVADGHTYTSDDIEDGIMFFADQDIEFITSKDKGNEVEFEALWAQAYVTTGSTSLSSYVSNGTGNYANYQNAYERNFHVVTSTGQTASDYQKSYPVTISSRYPDGNSGDGSLAAGGFTAAADTKFENIALGNGTNNTYTANNHDLVFGMGISGTVGTVRGHNCGTNQGTNQNPFSTNLDYTIRVERGTYGDFFLINQYSNNKYYSGTISIKAVLGCDYDRANNNDNSKLKVAASDEIKACERITFTNSSNKDRLTFDWNVKSGKIQENLLGTATAEQSLYMGGGTSYQYMGKRRLVMEGGELASIAGGIDGSDGSTDNPDFTTYNTLNAKDKVYIRIKGNAHVRGVIYGAAQYASSAGGRTMIFTGGQIDGWIAGGCNGTQSTRGDLLGNTYIYFGGEAKVGTATGGTHVGGTNDYGTNGADGGIIFGAGCGILPTDGNYQNNTVGQVNNSTIVLADNAKVYREIYGGGNYGYVREGGTSNIQILGGEVVGFTSGNSQVKGNVFGGSNSQVGRRTTIKMVRGTVNGNIYGGSNSWGTTDGLATITVLGGVVDNVFGGGYGSSTDMSAGTEVNIEGGSINNNVYGGGALGTVTAGGTEVNVKGGTMKDVYGAGKGQTTTPVSTAEVTGQTNVHVTGGSIVNVYGGGEAGDVVCADAPASPAQTLTYNFEDSEIPSGWTANNWNIYTYSSGSSGTNYAHNGTHAIGSYYDANNAVDNWLISQRIPLGGSFSFWVRHEMASYQGSTMTDNITVYVSTTGTNPTDFIAISETFMPSTTYTNYSYNLSDYEGEYGYVAIRHTSAADQAGIFIDDVTINTPAVEADTYDAASFVTIAGANISGDVFGGGKLGKTTGNTQVNIESGNVRGNVFGGAYGDPNQVFVAGMHTVNMMGGRIFGNLYGGSRNANDALAFEEYSTTETKTSSVVNISAGQVDQQVYAAGYYGKTFGSVYVMIGKEAILNAPHKAPSFGDDNETKYKAGNLRLYHNVWAGGDWGEFQGGSFGAPTVSGYSDIYVDGDGYNTETETENAPTYMNIAGSIYCCGTSCDAGTKGRAIYVSNYGHANSSGSKDENFPEPYTDATRTLYSLQRADTLIINNSHINFIGQAKIYSLDATEKYAFVSFDKTVRIVNGSSLFLNAIASQIKDFWSATCEDVYATEASYSAVAYNGLGTIGGPTDNKIRVNGGNYIEVYHDKMIGTGSSATGGYGMLNGFAHMMVAESTSDNTCAYARPKQCQDTPIDNTIDNPTDGGFVSYDSEKNTFTIGSGSYANNVWTWTSVPSTVIGGGSDQMPYENHVNQTKNGEQYFRIWRAGGEYSMRQAVVNIIADGQNTFDFVDVSVPLPAWRDAQSYFKFETTGTGTNLNTTIAYGSDVMMYNSAIVSTTTSGSTVTQNWIHFDEQGQSQETGSLETALEEMRNNPNVNFGLVTMAGTAMSGNSLIVCNESDAFLAKVTGTQGNYQTVNKFTCDDFEKNPEVTLRFTYSNLISTNMTWDPMYITLVQVDKNNKVKDIVKIAITINVATTIDREFTTQTYAIMNGTGSPNDEYVAKVVLPTFEIYDPLAEHLSQFKLQSVTFAPETGNDAVQESWIKRGGETINGNWQSYDINHFAMEISAANNEDNTDGWNGTSTGFKDSKTNANANGLLLGENGGREPFAFDFRLTYNGNITYTDDKPRLGVLTFNLTYDNVKVQTGTDQNGNPVYGSTTKNLVIKVHVIRRGKGAAFYLDGQNGSNANDAKHPDKAVLALSTIYNRCGYLPGDIIYVVNTVDVADELEWSGTKYNGVTIYRYPGGHDLSQTQAKDNEGNLLYWEDANHSAQTTIETDWPVMISGEIVDNEDNEAFTGNLINVKEKGKMEIRDIILDGHKSVHPRPAASKADDAGVESTSPLITVASGGTLTLSNGAMLQENNTTANGGAVAVNDGGTLMMNKDAIIANNVTTGDGGGVYMAGTMIVSDNIQIWENKKVTEENNVFLTAADKVIQIGTTVEDEFGPLVKAELQKVNEQGLPLYWSDANHTETTTTTTDYPVMVMTPKIGVTKNLTGDVEGFTRVVYVEDENDIAWLEVPFNDEPNSVIYHDKQQYQLVKYKNPQFLYWIGTWVTVVTWNPYFESRETTGYTDLFTAEQLADIHTPQQLAWAISLATGYNKVNNGAGYPNTNFKLTADIDMDANIWVPIGNSGVKYTGTFDGNGHVVTGIHSILTNTNAGMFGVTEGATITNMVAQVNFDGDAKNKGSVIGSMMGGTLSNVEAAGTLVGKESTVNLGGLVGVNERGNIHSSFAVNEFTAENAETIIGGLVADNSGNLYNSYSNITLGSANAANTMAGLVGVNTGTVENCYVVLPAGFNSPAFVHTNQVEVEGENGQTTTTKGKVNYCYAASGVTSYVGSDATGNLTGHGTYANVKERKEIGYLYNDNAVTALTADTTYVRSKLTYKNGQIATWPGLLSTLNQWVKVNSNTSVTYTPWNRPTTSTINGDLPVLCFPSDNSLATEDGKFLYYGAADEIVNNTQANNGLDNLFTKYDGKTVNMFLYGNATDVTKGNGNNMLFINEDAVLLQSGSNDITATVGVTFDNSDHGQKSYDYYGHQLEYDWHMMSTPLSNALTGATYSGSGFTNQSGINIGGMVDGYFPNGLTPMNGDVKWDFYTYYEPHYHWINLKRGPGNHWHMDGGDEIEYEEDDNTASGATFIPGKGYMMAIGQDSYMSSTGVLNKGSVSIALTNQEELTPVYNKGWNLVGNPYQAYLNISSLGTIYIYDADMGVYAPYTTTASNNPVIPAQNIHAHQAFFYHAASDGATLTFTPDMATTTADAYSYFRGDRVNYPLVNLFAENERGNRDLAVVELNRPEIGGATKMSFMTNANFEVSASLEGQDYGLLFTPEGTERVPVHFTTQEDGTYTLTWNTQNGEFTSLLLVDNMTGTITDMLRADHYTFDATTEDYASRFYITYRVTAVDENNEGDGSFAYFDGSQWVVNGKGQLDIVDVTGRVLFSKRLANEQNRVSLNGVAAGVYLLRVSDGNNTMVQKIVVK